MSLAPFVLFLLAPGVAGFASGVTVLFQNDGNWTSHGEKPSALLMHRPTSYDEAIETCASNNETLLSCDNLPDFHSQLSYQTYLRNTASDELFWSSCNKSTATSSSGAAPASNNTSESHRLICTNTAPFVDKIDTDFSTYPRVQTAANGTTFEGLRDHMAFRFLGIPFAQPPVGQLRFKLAEPWDGTAVDATSYGTACLQNGWYKGNAYGLNPWGNSEDCLYLNVFTPTIPDPASNSSDSLKPVLFWMHGGGQVMGTGVDAIFDGASLVSRSDVVLVTINYRLNIFGYLSLDDDAVPGNFATSDKIAALHWVKKYISGFGGNPDNITIFGQSAGGGSVIDLLTSPRAEGLFDGAIIMSGGRGWASTAADAAAAALPLIEPYCPNITGTQRLECLQSLPAETLLNLTTHGGSWQSVVDSNYTLDMPIAQVAKGRQAINNVNLMLGFMPEEGQSLLETALAPNVSSFPEALDTLVGSGSVSEEQAATVLDSRLWLVGDEAVNNGSTVYTDAYNASVDLVSDLTLTCYGSQFASVAAAVDAFESLWVYRLERAYGLSYYNWYGLCSFPVGKPETPYYRCHSGDLYEVFGTYYLFDLPVRVDEDVGFTNAVQDIWAAFARTGDPNVDRRYLEARGYNTTLALFDNWQWPEFGRDSSRVAALQYPEASETTLPEQRHCEVLLPLSE